MNLVINTYGSYLHIKDDMFEVIVPQDKGVKQKHYFAFRKIKSIFIHKGAAMSTDAIIAAVKNNIDIVVLENNGTPVGRFWHSRPGSTTRIRKKQLQASVGPQAVRYVKQWLARKLDNQIDFMKRLKKHRASKAELIQETIDKTEALKQKVLEVRADRIDQIEDSLRGWEGTAGRLYFGLLSQLLPERYRFNGRSFRPAKDPFNAFLNYAYGILYSRVEQALVIAGLDPYTGFMHRDDYNTKSLVFDFIEPYRIMAEEPVFKLFSAKKVNDKHTDKITGGYSLNDNGKALLTQHFFKFFEEDKIRHKGRNVSRATALQLDAHAFAQELLKS